MVICILLLIVKRGGCHCKLIDPTKNVDTGLLKNLAIGVFAIVMTLLVLDLKAPATNSEQLTQ